MSKRVSAAVLACVLASSAQAHRFHAAMTDISHNERSGSVEVIHTTMAHDIEALLVNLYQRDVDLSRPEDEALLRKYVEKQFYLLDAQGKRLTLHWVGVQADADSVVIYMEAEHTPLSAVARVHDGLLIDFLSDQQDTVNIDHRTLNFRAGVLEQDVR